MPKAVVDASGTRNVFPDSFTNEDIAAAIGVPPESVGSLMAADSSRVKVNGHFRGKPKLAPKKYPEIRRRERLQSLGMFGGAIGGTIAGVPGATAGGIAGRAATRVINDIESLAQGNLEAVPTPQEALREVLGEGAVQGVSAVGGNILAGGLKKGARLVGGAAFFKAPREAIEAALNHGITHTPAGLKKLMETLGNMGARTASMLRFSQSRGAMFDSRQVLDGSMQKLLGPLEKNRLPHAADDLAKFQELNRGFLAENTKRGVILDPLDLQRIKTDANKFADPIFKSIARKEQVDATTAASARWHKALAEHAQELLEKSTPDMIDPLTGQVLSLAEANAETQSLIKLKQAIAPDLDAKDVVSDVLRAHGRTMATMGIGAGTGLLLDEKIPGGKHAAALAGALAVNPASLSSLALIMKSGALGQVARQAPRLAVEAMREPKEKRGQPR